MRRELINFLAIALPLGAISCAHRSPGDSLETSQGVNIEATANTVAPTEPPVWQPPAGELNLREAVAATLLRHPALAAFEWTIRIEEARTLQAGLRPNPNFDAEVENILGSGTFTGVDQAETTLQLSQIIELWGKRSRRVKAAGLAQDVARRQYEMLRQEVVTETARAFFNGLHAQEELALRQDVLDLADSLLQSVYRRVNAGKGSPVEESKAKVTKASAEIDLDQAKRRYEASRQRLAAQWAHTKPTFTTLSGNLMHVEDVPDLDQLQARLETNPELGRWFAEEERIRALIELEHARGKPDVTLGGGYRRLSGPNANAAVFGMSMPLPLFNRNEGAIQEAQFSLNRAKDNQRTLLLHLETALVQFWNGLAAAHAQVKRLESEVLPEAQHAFELTQRFYEEARFSYLDVLHARQILVAARLRHIQALSDYHQALVDIESVVGEIPNPARKPK